MSANTQVNAAIDLESVGALESVMYELPSSTYFMKELTRCTQFSKMDVEISQVSGTPAYDSTFEARIPTTGDYLLHLYLEVELSEVSVNPDGSRYGPSGVIGYVPNLGHNLFKSASLFINETEVATLDSAYLDSEMEFLIEGGKYNCYRSLIGNNKNINPPNKARSATLPKTRVIVPLPFFFSRDSGMALPTAILTKSNMHIKFNIRKWNELIVLENNSNKLQCSVVEPTLDDLVAEPTILSFKVKGDYALVTEVERSSISCMTRLMLIEQPKTHPLIDIPAVKEGESTTVNVDAPLGAMKALFFGLVNTTHTNMLSNYMVGCPMTHDRTREMEGSKGPALDSIEIAYGDQIRVPESSSHFYSRLQPYYYGCRGPEADTGMHMYSFSLRPNCVDPTGTSNRSALKDDGTTEPISFRFTPTKALVDATTRAEHKEKFAFFMATLSSRLARICGGKFEILRADGTFKKDAL
jgi:Major capsid protein N-terminus/Large eukaryotic DNA virus major capsid protein